MGSLFYNIDPDGDTLLVLESPNAPFAPYPVEQGWPKGSLVMDTAEEVPDTTMENSNVPSSSEDNGPPDIQMRLSSKHLTLSSGYFKRLMSRNWKETTSESGYGCVVKAAEWDPEALLIVMNIIHHKGRAVPRLVSLEMIAKVAVLVDYYDCHEAVEPWAEDWVRNLKENICDYRGRELLLRFTIAWVFSDVDVMPYLTRDIIVTSRGLIDTLGLPIPTDIVDALNRKRERAISDLLSGLYSLEDGLHNGEYSCGLFECSSILVGSLAMNLVKNRLRPKPEPPFDGHCIAALDDAITEFRTPKWSSNIGPHGTNSFSNNAHICNLNSRLTSLVDECLQDSEDGLDCESFKC